MVHDSGKDPDTRFCCEGGAFGFSVRGRDQKRDPF